MRALPERATRRSPARGAAGGSAAEGPFRAPNAAPNGARSATRSATRSAAAGAAAGTAPARLAQSLFLHGVLVGALWGTSVGRPPRPARLGGPDRPAAVVLRLAPPAVERVAAAAAPEELLVTTPEPELDPAAEHPSTGSDRGFPAEPAFAVLPPPGPTLPVPRLAATDRPPPPAAREDVPVPDEPRPEDRAASAPSIPDPVAVDRRGATLLHAPEPEYPALSRRLGEEGELLCLLHVDARGAVERVEVVSSSGHARLDEAAVEALSRWRLRPALEDGVAVPSAVPHRVVFRLE